MEPRIGVYLIGTFHMYYLICKFVLIHYQAIFNEAVVRWSNHHFYFRFQLFDNVRRLTLQMIQAKKLR
jgi:hypothetical protein